MSTMFTDKLRFKELEETLANSTPLLAMVGAGDLAVEKIKAAREELVTRGSNFDPKAFREQAQATLTERVEALQTEVQTMPEQLRELPDKAPEWPAKAQAIVADIVAGAFSTYGDLAARGKTVVGTMRGEAGSVEHATPVTRPATSKKTTAKKPATRKPAAKKTTRTTKKAPAAKTTPAS